MSDRAELALPRTFRPRKARLVVYPVAGLVLLAFVGCAVFLPNEGPGAWGIVSRLGLVAMGLVIVWFMHRLAAVRLHADEAGVEVVNILVRTRLAWPQIVDVRLSRDDPWVLLDLSDGETLAVMGIQKTDGIRAERDARTLARLVVEHSKVEHDG
jgi:hypothetical protein